ncbi:MAG: chaperone modulator CbpM [Gammaproteobacteria bacterium]|nr:chaperone modulator CbpM [Gammaproteobacteria bacterium]
MTKVTIGLVLDNDHSLTLSELSRACSMHAEWVLELVDEGILEPMGSDMVHWRFSGHNLRRALVVRRLQQDLGVNLSGAALALELMEEVETLRARLNARSC